MVTSVEIIICSVLMTLFGRVSRFEKQIYQCSRYQVYEFMRLSDEEFDWLAVLMTQPLGKEDGGVEVIV